MVLNNKKILLLTDWYEPGYKAGGPIQSCKNIVQALHEVYEFYILTSDRDLGDHAPYAGIHTDCWTSTEAGVNIWYASSGNMNKTVVKNRLLEIKPDIVYFNSMFSPRFSLMPLWVLRTMNFRGKMIIAPRGMLHNGAMQQKAFKKKLFLKAMSASGITRRMFFHATDNQETKDIGKYFKKVKGIMEVANIPVQDAGEWQGRDKQPGQLRIVFISRIHPKKNLRFALQCVLELNNACAVQFDIYGMVDDESYMQRCRETVQAAGNNVQVNFKGPVSRKDLFPQLRSYHLFFLPTLGENFGHAIFEALSAGCPVLISDQTPWTNLVQQQAGRAIALSDKKGYVETLQEYCAMDAQQYNRISKSACEYAKNYVRQLNFREKYMELFG